MPLLILSKMAIRELLIFIAFASLVYSSEIDDVEINKRGVEKGTSVNTIPTGAQKEYTYNIYSQNPSTQTSPPKLSYQTQIPNSFYPNHASSQYFSSGRSLSEESTSYAPQPQANPSQSSTKFLPLNFMLNPGYQSKDQGLPSKPTGNIQMAFVLPNNYPQQSIFSYPQVAQTFFSPTSTNEINSHQSHYNAIPQFSVAPNYQPLSLGGTYMGQPSKMMLFAQPSPPLYNNFVYPNPVQSFHNYYPSISESKYSISHSLPAQSGYEKVQGAYSQNSPKEDNENGSQSPEYTESSDSNSSYKHAY